MADQRDRAALQRLLEDHSKLAHNEFYHGLLKYVEREAEQVLQQLAKESYTEQKLRYFQGAYQALKKVYQEYPQRLFDEIKREIDS